MARNLLARRLPDKSLEQTMKPQRAFGLVTATVLAACAAAWLTPPLQVPAFAVTADGESAPVVFSVR
jgi:ferric-dicitrate binding protein FerR (iron transport regulator)